VVIAMAKKASAASRLRLSSSPIEALSGAPGPAITRCNTSTTLHALPIYA